MNTLNEKQMNNGEPVRILHCVAGIGRGGYETYIMNLYRNIDRTKVQFDFLYSFGGVYKPEIEALGGRLYKIPFITEKGPFAYTKYVREFFASHPEYKIVHSHMDKFSGHIMREAKRAGIPVRISHSHSVASSGMLAYKVVKGYYGFMINPNCTDRFACSKEAGDWLFGRDRDDVNVVKNGIDLKKFSCEDKRDRSKLTIACVGRLAAEKNHTFLIDIFSEVYKKNKNAQLVIAGTGDTEAMLKDKVAALGLNGAVEFMGDCNDVNALLQRTDIMCLPSLFEGLGIVFVEAQACGVKCIASDRVPMEAKVSDDIVFIPLEKGAQYWADVILNTDVSEKKNNHDRIRECGYDIGEVADKVQKFYLEKFSRL
ncbi:MAG: glycosyltransferase [Oscillospiraceae bacterium]|nr:glycosyltransferase [Oscillospiraceae bacterium]